MHNFATLFNSVADADPDFSIPDPGSTQQQIQKGGGAQRWIGDPEKHPGSWSQKSTGSRIRNKSDYLCTLRYATVAGEKML
jgi:hypothetical protein